MASNNQNRTRCLQNFVLLWLDEKLTESNDWYKFRSVELQEIVGEVHLFKEADVLIDFITELDHQRVCLIASKSAAELLLPLIHSFSYLDSIFVLYDDSKQSDQWFIAWKKVKGVYITIQDIYQLLTIFVKRCNHDAVPFSYLPIDKVRSEDNLDQLDPSFMYTQLYKHACLMMDYDEATRREMLDYCRAHLLQGYSTDHIINQFERDYSPENALSWYTRECFIYQILNQGLRLVDGEVLVHMSFFIHDLQRQIELLHNEQIHHYERKPVTVYHGQGVSFPELENLAQWTDGLLSFNGFLSTSMRQETPLAVAQSAAENQDMRGILFVITVDPNVHGASFATIKDFSDFNEEVRVVFSMHSIFRIRNITKLQQHNRLYQVSLTLVASDNLHVRQIRRYFERMDGQRSTCIEGVINLLLRTQQAAIAEKLILKTKDTAKYWSRDVSSHIYMGLAKHYQGQFQDAFQHYKTIMTVLTKQKTPDFLLLTSLCDLIGTLYSNFGTTGSALCFSHVSLTYKEKFLPPSSPSIAFTCNTIGTMYHKMQNYTEALMFYRKALTIIEQCLPDHLPTLAIIYNNIGMTYFELSDYSKSLLCHRKALEIRERMLPLNHPLVASTCDHIGEVYEMIKDYPQAVAFRKRALMIVQKTRPKYDPDLAVSFNNLGVMCYQIQDYSNSLIFHQRAYEIWHNNSPHYCSLLLCSSIHIAMVYENLGDRSTALSYYKNALILMEQTVALDPNDLLTLYKRIGQAFYDMHDNTNALFCFEKLAALLETIYPERKSYLSFLYRLIGSTYYTLGKIDQALEFWEKLLNSVERGTLNGISELSDVYHNIGICYIHKGDFLKAAYFYEKSLEILERNEPHNYSYVSLLYQTLGSLYYLNGQGTQALHFWEKLSGIADRTTLDDRIDLAGLYNNLATYYMDEKDYLKAASFYEKLLTIQKSKLQENDPKLAASYISMGFAYVSMSDYSTAITLWKEALAIWEQTLSPSDPKIQTLRTVIASYQILT